MADSDLLDELRRVLRSVTRRLALDPAEAALVALHSNAIFTLPAHGLVVRIATNRHALARVSASVSITRWLARRGFPCTEPADLPGLPDQPIIVDGRIVTCWRHVTLADGPRPSLGELARLLRDLHGQPSPPVPPPPLRDPLDGVAAEVAANPDAIATEHRDWLARRIDQLRQEWREMAFPQPDALIHGDAHDHNLMRTGDGRVVLGDWDHVAVGPPAWDLVQPHYIHRRFARVTADDLDQFSQTYGADVRDWPGHTTLIEIREISGLAPYIRTAATRPAFAREVEHRLVTLRRGDTTARWYLPQQRVPNGS